MPFCDVCDEGTSMPYECDYCDGIHCKTHRLPENHDCSFENGETDEAWRSEALNTARDRQRAANAGGFARSGGPEAGSDTPSRRTLVLVAILVVVLVGAVALAVTGLL